MGIRENLLATLKVASLHPICAQQCNSAPNHATADATAAQLSPSMRAEGVQQTAQQVRNSTVAPSSYPQARNATNVTTVETIEAALRTCDPCRNGATLYVRGREPGAQDLHTICHQPVRAGLAAKFMIVYPPRGHCARCPAFAPRTVQ